MINDTIEFIADDGGSLISNDGTTFKLNAIKTGTVAHTRCGMPIEFTAEMLERLAPTWVGGFIKHNHENVIEGEILTSEWHDPHVVQTIGNLNDKVTASIIANQHTGFSIDAAGNIDDLDTYHGTGISVLYDSHKPACNAAAGCGVTGVIMADEDKNIAEIVADKLQIDTLASKLAEAEAIIAEKITAAESLYTKEQMDAATVAAIEASETTKETVIAAKEAVKGMFTKGMDETFEAEVMTLIEAEDYHGTVLKLGTVDFSVIEAHVPSGEVVEKKEEIVASESKNALNAALDKLGSKYIGA